MKEKIKILSKNYESYKKQFEEDIENYTLKQRSILLCLQIEIEIIKII